MSIDKPARLAGDRQPSRLWHYTCQHAAEIIDREGVLRPNPHPWWPDPIVWLTDLEDAPPEALFGYPTGALVCDRSDTRYEVLSGTVMRWTAYARAVEMPREIRDAFEAVPGGMPAHWWVGTTVLPVVASGVRL